ncbi:MAG TPA: hypothetical protein VMG82_00400 [Candidatus Sulfotelmatobacter sp.]|nr:hypothetical protein [Candidatus Sulfotelmatobacter sp.]
MQIIGVDLPTRQQTVAMLNIETGEIVERTLQHEGDSVRVLLDSRGADSRVLTSQEWVTLRVAESEELLWRKTCAQCHSLTFAPNAPLPSIAKSDIPARWFLHAVFDHDVHRFLKCGECHAAAATSQATADASLPGIQTCEKCHHRGAESAESRCFECHTYHDWTKEKPVKGTFAFPGMGRGN